MVQSFPIHVIHTLHYIDIRMMWAAWAPAGSLGRSRVHLCINCTLSPLGRRVMRGTVAGMILEASVFVVRKWLVAPESRMA